MIQEKEIVGNFAPGKSNVATILPGHIFNVPEIRKDFHPHSRVIYFPETLERILPGLWLIDIVLADNLFGSREPIDLKKLKLSEVQKQEFIENNGVPKDFFKR